MMKKIHSIFLLIIVVTSILRLFQLGRIPSSLDWDEVSLGYNAYSILKTGKDEFGQQFPLILRSFDDYKPALYAYLLIPFVAVFGLSESAVRMPSALFGIATVIATYFLVKELLQDKLHQFRQLPVIATGLLAISPWHIQFSRIAFEANVGASLNVFGLLFFLKGLKKQIYWYFSAGCFGLSVYVYQSEKVFVPLIGLVLIVIFKAELLQRKKQAIGAFLLFLIMALPFYIVTLTTPNALLRAKGVSVFADQTAFLKRTTERLNRDHERHDYLGLLFDNRRVTYAKEVFSNYLSHTNLEWLFVSGDSARHQAPNFGHLYLVELPFLLLGIYYIVFSPISKKTKWLLLGWALITPIPASVTSGVPHPVRAIHFLPLVHIVSASGIVFFLEWLARKRKSIQWSIFLVVFCISLLNVSYYLDQYFIQYNYKDSAYWQYGYKEAVQFIAQQNQYTKVIVSNEPPLEQSYMFFLFHLSYDPVVYLNEGGTESGGYAEQNQFGRYIFRPIQWGSEQRTENTLFVGKPGDFPSEVSPLHIIYYLDGTPAIYIVRGA